MAHRDAKTIITAHSAQPEVWRDVLEELRLLRHDLNMLLFRDDIENYENADQFKQSYKRAVKQHPSSVE